MIENRLNTKVDDSGKWLIVTFLKLIVALQSVVNAEVTSTIRNTKDCGGEYSGYQYTITSPNYPSQYPSKQTCIYTLRGNHFAKCHQVFHLQFLDFSLLPSENCTEDYVEIGDRNVYCGRVAGIRTYSSEDNNLVLRFHSNAGPGDKGFKILVTTEPCSTEQFDENIRAETAEPGGTLGRKVITRYFANGKIRSQEDAERLRLFGAEKAHPVYRPEIDFSSEDDRKFVRNETPSPPRVESLEENEENNKPKFVKNPTFIYPADNLEIPVHQSGLFRGSSSSRVEIVTPSSVHSIQINPPKISSYLFVPPVSQAGTTRYSAESFPNNSPVTSPPMQILLPNRYNTVFRQVGPTNFTRVLPFVQERPRVNDKVIVPARSYGVPYQPYYPSFQGPDHDIKTGEVQDHSRDTVYCQRDANLEPDLEVTDNSDNNGGFNNAVHPVTSYDSSVPSYPLHTPNIDVTPSEKYGPPKEYYPNDNVPENHRPNDWLPGKNLGSQNNFNNYPSLGPNFSGSLPVIPNFWNNRAYPECCSTLYTGQRFLLASPEFPSMSYHGDSYECIYSISPYSFNTCRMRFNFKFFNHGTEDRFCSYGYVEIDGRRVCGCKKGLSLVSGVTSVFPKIIRVKYTGYPRTKFNGFLIEVIQEPCSNGYPYLSRSKKEIRNSSREDGTSALENDSKIGNSTMQRTKRNSGYSYPKPNVGLIEDPAFFQSWNPGNSINGDRFGNHGSIGGNAFSPLLVCQAFSFFDWVIAAKEAYLRNGRCIRRGGIASPGLYPGYPPTNWIPSNGGIGPLTPGHSGNGGSGTIVPGYPGNGGPEIILPGAGSTGTMFPGAGSTATIFPGIGSPGTIFPVTEGPGTIFPEFPGAGGPGTIDTGSTGSGGWNFPSVRCEEINIIEGVISSPQYPINYPNNVKKCFRFFMAPDYCQLELAVLDFELENSTGCTKDYVILGGGNSRYCGRSLAGARELFDISRKRKFDVFFASDSFGTGRGFSIGFSQKPCRGLVNR